MDELTQYLMSDHRHHAKLSPEMLEMMGKEAAQHYLEDGKPLNDSIAGLVGEHDDVSADQVKRVVEFANQHVYLGLHEKSKTAGKSSSYPQFALADTGEVMSKMSAKASRVVDVPVSSDYGRAPRQLEAVTPEASDALLAELFNVKTASANAMRDHTPESGMSDIMGTKDDLKSMKGQYEHSAHELHELYKTASEEFYDRSKRHLLEGNSFSDIVAVTRIEGEEAKVASALQPFVARLIKEKVASPDALKKGREDFQKVAHRVVDMNHPLVTSFRAVLSLDHEIRKIAAALDDVDTQIGRVDAFIKEQLRAGSAA